MDTSRNLHDLADAELVELLLHAGLDDLEALVPAILDRGAGVVAALGDLARRVELAEGPPHVPESWAPVHALRLLGGLGLADALPALLESVRANPGVEEITDAWPLVAGEIGPAAIDPLLELLRDSAIDAVLRGSTVAAGLIEIGQRHAHQRARISRGLAALLEADGPPRDTFTSHLALTASGVNDPGLESAVLRALQRNRVQPELLTLQVFRYLRAQRADQGPWASELAGADPLAFYHPANLAQLRESVKNLTPEPAIQPSGAAVEPLWPGWPAPPPRGQPDKQERNRQKAERKARKGGKGRGHG